MRLTSPAFHDGGVIPKKYSRDVEDVNPPLVWDDVPEDTKTFCLVMEDPDVPATAGVPVWDHWVVGNIPGTYREIPEAWDVVGVRGKGTRGELAYGGPRPPDREHRYFFRLYALDSIPALEEGMSKTQLMQVIQGHILAEAQLMGRFSPPVEL